MSKKRIMFLCHGAGNGGAERVITTLASSFASDGYKVALVTTNKEHNDYKMNPLIKRKVIFSEFENVIERTFDRVIQLRNFSKAFNPACIISFSSVSNMQAIFSTIGLKSKIIISERTDPSRYPTSSIAKKIRLVVYPYADKIVFQTRQAMEYFPQNIQKKGMIIFNPIRNDLPVPYMGERENRIVGIGSLGEQKNWIVALKAAEIFFKKHPEYRFDIFGEGPARESLQDYIFHSELLNGRVSLRGFSHDAVEQMSKARMYISSSNYDGIPNSMLEALACGVPTIYTDCPVGGPREFIRSGENGFLVPVGNSRMLAEKMILLAEDDSLCKKFSTNSINIRNQLQLNKIVSAWEEVVEQIC